MNPVSRPRAVLLCSDLLFGSKVQAALAEAGWEAVPCVADDEVEREIGGAALLVADLSDEQLDTCALVAGLNAAGKLAGVRTLGYYQHVDDATRLRALEAGFDGVVPRSKLFREGPRLLRDLLPPVSGDGD